MKKNFCGQNQLLKFLGVLFIIFYLGACSCENATDTSPPYQSSDDDSGDDDSGYSDDSNSEEDDSANLAAPKFSIISALPDVEVTVSDPPLGNLLAREIQIVANRPCSLSGYLTDELEPGKGFSRPIATPIDTKHSLWFFGLLEDRKYEFTIHLANHPTAIVKTGEFYTPKLPQWAPKPMNMIDTGEAARDQWIALEAMVLKFGDPFLEYAGVALILDREGRIRFLHEMSNPMDGLGHFLEGIRILKNGDIVMSDRSDLVAASLYGTDYKLFDVQLNQPYLIPTHHIFYVHEDAPAYAMVLFNRFGPGFECDQVTPTLKAVGDGVAEIDANGVEQWRWTVFDHLDKIPPSDMNTWNCIHNGAFWGFGTYDWTHANTVAPIPDQNAFLISFRNISRIVKVDRSTGEIIWQLGKDLDFQWIGDEPEQDRWPLFQHDPHWLGDNHLLLFDNGNCRYQENCDTGPWSRALELEVDEENMTAQIMWEHRVPFSAARGGVERLENGNTLICTGIGSLLIEVTPDHREIWKIGYLILPRLAWAKSYPALWDYNAAQ